LERALEAERSARDAAEAALRLRDEFLSTASHELRTPLAVLRLQAQLTLRQWERARALDADRVAKALNTIDQQADKVGRLVDQLLDVSRLDSGKLTLERRPADVAELVRQVATSASALANRHTISIDAPQLLQSEVDTLRLEQVLVNLLDNAIKYSPPQTVVDLQVEVTAGVVRIIVRDQGPGIPLERRARLFERIPPSELRDHTAGLGLGLFLSRQFVELHGGRIGAEFPPDGGACFRVELPVAAQASAADAHLMPTRLAPMQQP
jgi:signal transduction histidine kinase